jgi:rSAM/selenodomain-associated transferase 2
MDPTASRVSVIIPTLNEATVITETVRHLRAERPDEIVVADGSSPDGTAAAALAAGATVVESPRGRGPQQNRGARAASGDVLLFLHADCRLEPGAIGTLRRFLARHPRVPAGCFRMRVDAGHPLFRSIDLAAHLRAGVLGIVYGDQGLFVRRDAFEAVGGFPDVPLMEDVLISMRLKRVGRLALLGPRVFVSPRRWRKQGLILQTLRNWSLQAALAAGLSPLSLANHYPDVR